MTLCKLKITNSPGNDQGAGLPHVTVRDAPYLFMQNESSPLRKGNATALRHIKLATMFRLGHSCAETGIGLHAEAWKKASHFF